MPSTLLKHYADFWGFFDRDKTHLHPNKHEFTHNIVNGKEKPSSPFWFMLSGLSIKLWISFKLSKIKSDMQETNGGATRKAVQPTFDDIPDGTALPGVPNDCHRSDQDLLIS